MATKVLNLYAGIGGNRKLWTDCEVTAVELNPSIANIYKSFFPQDELIVGDAREYLLANYKNFDFIWSSNPCTTHSDIRRMGVQSGSYVAVYPDLNLYSDIIFLKHYFKGKWVVENVIPYYKPLVNPNVTLDRHHFWSNFNIPEKRFEGFGKGHIKGGHAKELQLLKKINIDAYKLKDVRRDSVLRSYVNPEIGKYIFDCAFKLKQRQIIEVFQ